MRTLRTLLLLGALGASGCPDKTPPPPTTTTTTVPTYERASDAVKARIPTGGLPTDPAVKNLQRGLEEAERSQDRRKEAVDKAAGVE